MKSTRPMNILIAVDGSEHAMAGVRTIHDLPIPAGSQITVMSVFIPRNASNYTDYERYVQLGHDELQEQPWQVTTEVAAGNPAETLTTYADQHGCDLIVIGARGVRSALGVLLGGVAQQVVEYANRAVLVVRAPYYPMKRILLALDGSACSDLALRYLAQLPLPKGVHSIDLVHVLPPPPLPQALAMAQTIPMGLERATMLEMQESEEIKTILKDEERQGQKLLKLAAERYAKLSQEKSHLPEVNQVLLRGDAFEEINRYIEEHPTELILVGSRGLSGVKSWLLGSLSRKLVHGAPCSVLVVRGSPNC
jgi:nucleotide-binding universal stress UspA family protein